MKLINEFDKIIIEEKDIISFLKSLSVNDKKALSKHIIKSVRHYSKIIEYKSGHYKSNGTDKQLNNLQFAAFVCLNHKQYKSLYLYIRNVTFEKIIDWYQPKWINEFINNEITFLNYTQLLYYLKRGFIAPSHQLIAEKLQESVYVYSKSNGSKIDIIQFLFSDKIILKEHFWYIFQYETSIHFSEGYGLQKGRIKKEENWYNTIKTLIQDGKLDRKKVLIEAFLCSTRNFNKRLTAWFFNLITFLKPTDQELLQLQKYIFLSLEAKHSKPITDSLGYIKRIYSNRQFKKKEFVELSQLLLTSKYKSIINSTLTILNYLAKNNNNLHKSISINSAIALMFSDSNIQKKAIKIILNYGDKNSDLLLSKINEYSFNLFSENKIELQKAGFTTLKKIDLPDNYNIEKPKISQENKIQELKNFEDLIFFYSQVFENNEAFHFDLFVSYFPTLISSINKNNISQLEPAFQRACEILSKNLMNGKIGLIEKIMAIFFINYFTRLIFKYPGETQKIKKIYEKYFDKYTYIEDNKYDESNKIDLLSLLPSQNIYDIYISLLNNAERITKNNLKSPVLSTPTHTPCYINVMILIEKLSYYENISMIDATDFQVAISRLVIEKNEKIISVINEKLTGEIKDIFLYLFDLKPANDISIKTQDLWIPAILRKKDVFYSNLSTDYETKFNLYLDGNSYIQINDEKRFLTLCPFNPEILLRKYIEIDFNYFTSYADVWAVKNIINTLSILYELWDNYDSTAYLYLAYSFLYFDKTVRTLAVEIWIKFSTGNNFDNELLGKMIGQLEKKKNAPLKRFTDLIIERMINISKNHNKKLEILLRNTISEINNKSVKGLKKLLEIYNELV